MDLARLPPRYTEGSTPLGRLEPLRRVGHEIWIGTICWGSRWQQDPAGFLLADACYRGMLKISVL